MNLEVRAFGAMEIARGAVGLPVGSRSRQVLLAMLVVHRGSVVPVDTLAERMWPGLRPDNPANRLRVQVHRLRRALGDTGAVRHHPPGYALAVPADRVDVHRFEELIRQGRGARSRGAEAAAVDLLRQALGLCRGPAFQGLDDIDDLAVAARRLAELRLSALEDRITAELSLGEHTALVAELEGLVGGHPLRERFRAQLMTALHRAGRRADALSVYRQGRQILVEELGVEPNEECQALMRAILVGDRAAGVSPVAGGGPVTVASPVPRQLPPDVTAFTGRTAQLRRLDDLLATAEHERPTAMVIVAVDGTAGVGKTALAVHWAHRASDRFRDGQLYVNLRGHTLGHPPLPVAEALTRLLHALGASADEVPGDEDEAAARYRSLVADKRILVVLDNAASADQVRPLLPGGSGCLAVVTSRYQLPGLVARDGAHRLVLPVLTPTEATALLGRLLGADRVAAEPAATAELARLCGHLPLALRVAGASLARHPQPRIADWAERLRGEGLAALAVPGDQATTVTAAIDLSYHRLPAAAGRMFRLAGLVPGPEVTEEAAAALAGGTLPEAAAQLAELIRAHLVEESAAGRYTSHDLLRRYAAQRAQAEETGPDRAAARGRLYDFYRDTTDAAVELLFPGMLRLPGQAGGAAAPVRGFSDPAGALAWLEAERANLTAAVAHAATHGPPAVAWRLADRLRTFLAHCGHAVDALAVARAGLAAAEADREPHAQAGALLGMANVYFQLGRYQLAGVYAGRGWRLVRDTDWLAGQGAARYLLGAVCTNVGRGERAIDHYLAALARFDRIGWRNGQAAVVSNVSVLFYRRGRLRQAAEYARRAAAVFAELGSVISEAGAYIDLGGIHHVRGELDRALDYFTRARERHRAVGSSEEAEAVVGLAGAHRDAGRLTLARELAETAAATAQEAGNRGLEPECLVTLASIQRQLGLPRLAADGYLRAVELARETGDRGSEASALIGLAAVRPAPGGYGLARERATAGLAITREIGYRILEGEALTRLAEVELADGAVPVAIGHAEQALACHREIGYRLEEARTHAVLGHARLALREAPAARQHWHRAQALFSAVGAPEPDELSVLRE